MAGEINFTTLVAVHVLREQIGHTPGDMSFIGMILHVDVDVSLINGVKLLLPQKCDRSHGGLSLPMDVGMILLQHVMSG